MSMMDKLKDMVGKNPDKAQQGLDKASDYADEKTGGKYSDKIDKATEKGQEYIDSSGQQGQGGDQGQEGGQQQ